MRAVLFPLALSLALLTGCPAAKLSREAAQLAEAGKPYPAAMHYLDALDKNPKLGRAQKGLDATKGAAYDARLAAAREAESGERFPDALTAYRELHTLLERLDEHGGLGKPAIDVNERISAMENAAAEVEYTRGERMLGNKAYAKAVDAYKKALTFKPGYRDAAAKIGAAFFAWGESEEAQGHWRDAAGRFVDAAAAGHAGANARAGSLYAALGRHHTDAGTCRQAVRDYRAARDQLGLAGVKDALAAAEACARTPVAVLPFANPTKGAPGGVAVPDALAAAITAELRTGASAFVDTLDRAAVDRLIAANKGSAASVTRSGRLAGARWLVVGELTQAAVRTPAPVDSPHTVNGTVRARCEVERDGTRVTEDCAKDIVVRYVEHELRVDVRLAGQLRVTDAATGAQSAMWPFDVTQSDTVRFADGFIGMDGAAIRVVRWNPGPGDVTVPDEVHSLAEARRELAYPSDLAKKAIAGIAQEGAKVAAGIADAEPPLRDPATLPR